MIERVEGLISNLLSDKRIELVDVVYRREGGRMVLRLLCDKEGGITLDDCTNLNEEISKILDNENFMPEKYLLEVNSPGLDRHLKTRRDFQRVMGKRINVHTYEPIDEKRDFNGEVESVDSDSVTVSGSKISLNKISKAKLEVTI